MPKYLPLQDPPCASSGEDELGRLVWRFLALSEPIRLRWWSSLRLTLAQLRLLFAVAHAPGATVSGLAAWFGVRPPTVTGLIDKLVQSGLVCRRESPEDRRVVMHHVTEQGTDVLTAVKREGREFLTGIFSRMTEEEKHALAAGMRAFIVASAGLTDRLFEEEARTTVGGGGSEG